jgi:hypothetical protein
MTDSASSVNTGDEFAEEEPIDAGIDTTSDTTDADLATDYSTEELPADNAENQPTEELPVEDGGEETENPDEPILKTVQKLTGKLSQKMRDGGEELTSKDYKYVINSIVSAIDMTKISEEDMTDILNKIQNKDSEDTTEQPTEQQPVQEEPKDYLNRIQKSIIDEFLSK